MLFDNFIKQYIKDYIECSDTEYDITEEDIKDIIDYISYDDRLWEVLDSIISIQLEDYIKECEE